MKVFFFFFSLPSCMICIFRGFLEIFMIMLLRVAALNLSFTFEFELC